MTMSHARAGAVLGVLGLVFVAGAVAEEPANVDLRGKLGELRVDAALVGEAWKYSPGLVIEDIDATPKDPKTPEEKVIASVAAAMRPAGVVAVADYTYMTKKQDPTPDVITVRVIVFRNTEAAVQWWDKKYDPQGAGKGFYRSVDGVGDRAVDSTEVKKRIALAGNVLITCSQLKGAEEYSKVIAHYVEKIAAATRGQRGAKAPAP
jgi:hypothetical protein